MLEFTSTDYRDTKNYEEQNFSCSIFQVSIISKDASSIYSRRIAPRLNIKSENWNVNVQLLYSSHNTGQSLSQPQFL